MIEKKIKICLGQNEAGSIEFRLSLLKYDDGELDFRHYVRGEPIPNPLPPGTDLAATRKMIENHLALRKDQNGIPHSPWPAITDEEWRNLENFVTLVHTPAVLKKANAEQTKLCGQLASLRAEIKTNQDALKTEQADIERLALEVAQQLAQLKGEQEALDKERKEIKTKQAALQTELAEHEQRTISLMREITVVKAQRETLQQQKDALTEMTP